MIKRVSRIAFWMLVDILLVFSVYSLPLLGNLNVWSNHDILIYYLCFVLPSAILMVIALFLFRQYHIILSLINVSDCVRFMLVSGSVSIISMVIMLTVPALPRLSSGVASIAYICVCIPQIGVRMIKRIFHMLKMDFSVNKKEVRTLIVGAGEGARLVLSESKYNKHTNNHVVALIDDNPNKIGRSLEGYRIYGPIDNISSVIKKFNIEQVIIAIAFLSKEELRRILDLLKEEKVSVKRLPLMTEMPSSESDNNRKIIDVDINELLGREEIIVDNPTIRELIHNKTILITGAGGSIGGELSKQIFSYHPSTLILFDIYENGVYDVQQDIIRKMRKENIDDINLVVLIGSTYNETRLDHIFSEYHPELVFHAAAYKHVPLMEDSPEEAIRTNIFGTWNVAKLSDKYKVTKMVLVSTDKAVRPTNVMGATKSFAEMIIRYWNDKSKNSKYSAVRFGNVLGSNGSVIPLFKKQIQEGGPLTVTDPNIIRYFMTIPEAVSLILQSGAFADGGEIFILDMGEPVKILDLALRMITLSGNTPYKDIDIVFTGLRPGEKLYEELLLDPKTQKKTDNSLIYIERKKKVLPVDEYMSKLEEAFTLKDSEPIKCLLGDYVHEFRDYRKKKE